MSSVQEDRYLNFVNSIAEQRGQIFMLDTGEGNDFIDAKTGWHVEDLSGWLICPNEKGNFLESKKMGTAYEKYSDMYVFAKWEKANDGSLRVIFNKY